MLTQAMTSADERQERSERLADRRFRSLMDSANRYQIGSSYLKIRSSADSAPLFSETATFSNSPWSSQVSWKK